MKYQAYLSHEGRNTLAEFPDCPGCQTFAGPSEDIEAQAKDALVGWLEAHLALGRVPAHPKRHHGDHVLDVHVPARLAVKLELRWARDKAGVSQAELARRLGKSQSAIAQVEKPDSNPSISTLEEIAEALGVELTIGFATARAALRAAAAPARGRKAPRPTAAKASRSGTVARKKST